MKDPLDQGSPQEKYSAPGVKRWKCRITKCGGEEAENEQLILQQSGMKHQGLAFPLSLRLGTCRYTVFH